MFLKANLIAHRWGGSYPLLDPAGRQAAMIRRIDMRKTAGLHLSVKTILLGAALSLTMATAASAQSYDPDLGSGNLVRPYGGARHFGRIPFGWRAMVVPHRAKHGRQHRLRHN
jgi:hypothetical protein